MPIVNTFEIKDYTNGNVMHKGEEMTEVRFIQSLVKSGADLSYADMRGKQLGGANFTGGNFRKANFGGAHVAYANFTGANLSESHFDKTNASGAIFYRSDLEGAAFWDADLTGATFHLTDLEYTIFERAKLAWGSHSLMSELLKRAAYESGASMDSPGVVERLKVAGLIFMMRGYCWDDFTQMEEPLKDWALNVLAGYVVEGDNHPKHLDATLRARREK